MYSITFSTNQKPPWMAGFHALSLMPAISSPSCGSGAATAAQAGYTKTIMWSLDTIDWRPLAEGGPTAEQIASTVVTSSGSGSIILMHLGGYETLDALRIMVPALRERGLLLTSVSDLVD